MAIVANSTLPSENTSEEDAPEAVDSSLCLESTPEEDAPEEESKELLHGSLHCEEKPCEDDPGEEWRQTALDAEVRARQKDFQILQKLAKRLYELRPTFPRGWLLQYEAMKGLSAPHDALLSLLQEAVKNCRDSKGVQEVVAALSMESGALKEAPADAVDAPARDDVQAFVGEWDHEGVFVYQAFCDEIADWALAHQAFGGPHYKTTRMTWIKPSFGWVLYRSKYGDHNGRNPGQRRVLKIKLPHDAVGDILSQCQLVDTNKETRVSHAMESSGGNGRIQWDPERDVMSAEGREPRKMLRRRAIQIGLIGKALDVYLRNVISIADVTELAHKVCDAHMSKKRNAMAELLPELPNERMYKPCCDDNCLRLLGMLPGGAASALSRIGRGKASKG